MLIGNLILAVAARFRLPGCSVAFFTLSLAPRLAPCRAYAVSRVPLGTAAVGPLPNPTRCGADSPDGEVHNITDDIYERCFSIITPLKAKRPMPVLFWFHAAGNNAAFCADNPLAAIARARGFALVCGEALQLTKYGEGGHWAIPEVQTNASGTKCDKSDSPDIAFMNNVIDKLGRAGIYDTKRLFFSGCSMGSAFSIYIAQCMKSKSPAAVSAFATHSTGLKVKGDGNNWPPSIFHPAYVTAECPQCEYFPIVPKTFTDDLGLKACIFDNTGDPTGEDPLFYRSSVTLGNVWSQLGMAHEQHFGPGGHCERVPHGQIVACLDDGTGRLLVSHARSSGNVAVLAAALVLLAGAWQILDSRRS